MQDTIIKTELNKVLGATAGGTTGTPTVSVVMTNNSSPGAEAATAGVESAGSAQHALADAIALSTAQLEQVRASVEGQLASLTDNTRALLDNTAAKSVASTAARVGSSVLNNVLGGGLLGGFVSGLMSLFGGDDKSTTTTSVAKFALPSSVSYSAGMQDGQIAGVDYGQNDQPRGLTPPPAGAPQQITVNVTAMDSRSFLDHSTEIASAVRKAILESSSLNDVLGEL